MPFSPTGRRSEQDVGGTQRHHVQQADAEIGDSVAGQVAFQDLARKAQLSGVAAERFGAAKSEGLIASGQQVGVDPAQIDPVALCRREIGHEVDGIRRHRRLARLRPDKGVGATASGQLIEPAAACQKVGRSGAEKRIIRTRPRGVFDGNQRLEAVGAGLSPARPQIDGHAAAALGEIVVPRGIADRIDTFAALEPVLPADRKELIRPGPANIAAVKGGDCEEIVARVQAAAKEAFEAKLALVGEESFTQFERMVLLQTIDSQWREHLSALDYLRQGIHLRGYAQKQPKQEYKREAFVLFGQLLDSVKNDVSRILMNVRVQSAEQITEEAEQMEARGEQIANVTYTAPTETGDVESRPGAGDAGPAGSDPAVARVGRNDPCPCGSGKKYKHCHGLLT